MNQRNGFQKLLLFLALFLSITPCAFASTDSSLFGKRWILVAIDGASVNTTKPYIEFDDKAKRFSGDGGCNRIAGGFELEGNNLKFSRVISTRMACLDSELQEIETKFVNRLEQTTNFQIEGASLSLLAGSSTVLSFKTEAEQSSTASITGTVTYLQRRALAPDAILELKLVDISFARPRVIAQQTIETSGRQVPIEYALSYDAKRINIRHRYVVRARILEGAVARFSGTQRYPVTGAQNNVVDIVVRPVIE